MVKTLNLLQLKTQSNDKEQVVSMITDKKRLLRHAYFTDICSKSYAWRWISVCGMKTFFGQYSDRGGGAAAVRQT